MESLELLKKLTKLQNNKQIEIQELITKFNRGEFDGMSFVELRAQIERKWSGVIEIAQKRFEIKSNEDDIQLKNEIKNLTR